MDWLSSDIILPSAKRVDWQQQQTDLLGSSVLERVSTEPHLQITK
jgi:hypothetical protein